MEGGYLNTAAKDRTFWGVGKSPFPITSFSVHSDI
jgi:hypothetical protein